MSKILTLAELISLPYGSVVRCTNGSFEKVSLSAEESYLQPVIRRVWQHVGAASAGDTSLFGANVLQNFEPVYYVSGPVCDTCDLTISGAPGITGTCSCSPCPACFDRVDSTKICEVCDQCSDCCGCVACEEGDHKVAQANLCDNCSKCDSDAESHCECPVCSGCSEKSDGVCEECSQCSDCCDCRACQGVPRGYGNTPRRHKDMVPEGDDYCELCDRCFACCEHIGNCYTCSGCDERRSMDEGGTCSNCDECPDCCSNTGDCFNCEHCNETQSTENQCAQCSQEGDDRCDDHCPGHEPDFEPLREREEPRATIPGLRKWTPTYAEIAEKAVSTSYSCRLADVSSLRKEPPARLREILPLVSNHAECRNEGGVAFGYRNRRQDMTAIVADSFKINKSRRFLTCEIETDHGGRGYGDPVVALVADKWDMKIEHDGSVRGKEIITTPANGDAFVRQAEELCSALVQDQVVATHSGNYDTGFHLHVDARDLSWVDLKRMFTLWNHVERAALDTLRPERQATLIGGWAEPRSHMEEAGEGAPLDPRKRTGGEGASQEDLEKEARKRVIAALGRERGEEAPATWIEDETPRLRTPGKARRAEKVTLFSAGSGEWATDRRPGERYFALNGMSLFRLGTVEIRAFESTSNAEDLVCWGMLWAAFTDMSKGMSRKKMLQLIQKNPRSVLLDAAPNTRTKLWLKRRWKLYAVAESEGARVRKGLRHVKQVAAPSAHGGLTLAELDALPIGAMVHNSYARAYNWVKVGMPSSWFNRFGDPDAFSTESSDVQESAADVGLTAEQLINLPIGTTVSVPGGDLFTKSASRYWTASTGASVLSHNLARRSSVRLVSMPWTPPATVQYRW